jgi:CheY-like chemotaxis protein
VRVTQVIDNLLSNAIKFTPPGGWIALRLDGAGGRARLSITDSGIGFAPGFEREMFTAFVQAEQGIDRQTGGIGLGLAISKRLMDLHGGTLTATSDGHGKGARFEIEFTSVAAADAPKAPAVTSAPIRVLLVEDNPDVATTIADMIRWSGHEVDVAPDGAAALRQARAVRPDLILCDLGLPGEMDGFDVARACRDDTSMRGIRMVAVSGYGGEDYRQRTHAAGYDDMVTKPLALAKLRELVAAVRLPA